MATTMCVSGGALLKAGANVNTYFTGASADAAWTTLINQAESVINVVSSKNWTDVYATLDDDTKKILEDWCSNLAAMYAIQYDMNNYGSTRQAETMLDVLNNANTRNQSLLRDNKQKDFIG